MPATNLIEIESVRFEGFLEKQRKRATWAWYKCWFVIEDGQLAYYKDETRSEGMGLIDLGQAESIRSINNVPRNHSFEISMKERSHIFCAESDTLKDQWVRLLQQARLLRPRRSSSMMRPRCNSIPEECTPDQILSIEDLDQPDTPTSPCTPPWASPPNTPTSPLRISSPKFQKALTQHTLSNSPKFQRAISKSPNSPKVKDFLDQPPWIKGKEAVPSTDQVLLKGIRRLSESPGERKTEAESEKPHTYAVHQNSVFYVSHPSLDAEPKKVVSNIKSPVIVKKNKIPVTRMYTGPIADLAPTSNGYTKSHDQTQQRVVSRTTSQHPVVTRAKTTGSRPVSGPAHLSRARPVSGERPFIEARLTTYSRPCSTSSDSDSETSSSSSRKLHRLSGNDAEANQKANLIPSKSSCGGVVLRRNNVRSTRSVPYYSNSSESSDTDADETQGPDEVFTSTPLAATSPVFRFISRPENDEYYEKLNRAMREPRPAIPALPHPRLELTFRSAFDDIRLFLANNRDDDEIFPVPRKSERGGKAIKKLKKVLQII